MTVSAPAKKWWKEAVVYQIYPASFCDSNGDGVGDLPGITSKLDYIVSLGVDVIWICPMYDSPQVDMGYDIANYEDVYRPYGTVEDMEVLIRETHKRGLKIMLDLVINHTSDQHAWFKESRSSRDNPKRDWYIWKPASYDDKGERVPPNNWRCNFGGGSVWEWDEPTGEYYLHLFAKEQPDLNWEDETVRRAIYASSMEFWLDRGVDGFRVDTVNMYSKPPGFPDAPVTDPKSTWQPAGPLYCNGPRMHEFLGEMNEILARYGAITVGELPCTPDNQKVLKYVSAAARQLDMVFQFDVVDVCMGKTHRFETTPKSWKLPQLKEAIERTQTLIRGTDAWTTVFTENHDQARSVTRLTDDSPEFRVRGAKMLALLQSCLSGTQYVYQGQEIGCVNMPKDSYPLENYLDLDSYLFIDHVKSLYGADNAAEIDKAFTALQHLARDHARVPMPWDGRLKYGGFADVLDKAGRADDIKEPWMKPHPLVREIDVASQLDDPDSVLAFYRTVRALRKDHADLLVYGDYTTLRLQDPDLCLFVKHAVGTAKRALVVLNFTAAQKTWKLPTADEVGLPQGTEVVLTPVMSSQDGTKAAGEALAPFEGRLYLINA